MSFARRHAESMPLKYFSSERCGQLLAMVHSKACPGGGIGRRARFRSVYRKMWRFEFSPGHHQKKFDDLFSKSLQQATETQWLFCCWNKCELFQFPLEARTRREVAGSAKARQDEATQLSFLMGIGIRMERQSDHGLGHQQSAPW